jgi:cell surface protein SprA
MRNIRSFGRTTFYTHRANITYNLPINKIPMLDWVTANAGYAADFDWQAAPLAATEFGNTIENSNSKRLNINANFVNLYNKVGFLRQINQKSAARPGQRPQQRPGQPPARQQEQQEQESPDYFKIVTEGFIRMLMGVRNFSLNYTESNGTRLPGFQRTPQALGMDWDFDTPGYGAPGLGFVLAARKIYGERLFGATGSPTIQC